MKFVKILLLLTIAASCKTVKKVATIQEAIDKKDTTQTVVITETPKVDSASIVRGILEKVVTNNIQFKTFNAKIKVDYESAENSDSYTGYLSIAKDSLIYIRIRGSFLGISAEGLQVKISKDSVVLVKKVGDKYVQYRTIDYLKEATQIPFDFKTLQDLLIGNPVFVTNNIVSYRDGPSTLSVLMVGDIFKHLISLSNDDFKVVHSKLDDVDIQRNRTCAISFSNYQPMGTYQFATQRKIVVAEKSKLDINLDFKEFALNEPLKYTFEVPKNYKRK
ncbi:DUF4292 domain-containing protein [Sediminibacterium sp. TEGAF015]|uniref:DUF4292 domain-containing protein n=1 Tax=Sediminibacterium sp. TEGAF015 TaxID=575378 RepID=UPI0021F9D5C1|nr:DUF4292 domain-containing protein [Sediminibacterium sp. TEGAF015]BDQ13379.1 hypothetical protein TEGAF0_25960 [Sediminibacterium sp. TEGAF015]